MKKKIDWLNHFLEFIVVIIGILIAFQLEKCSNNNTQQQLVKTHLKYILEETKSNQTNVDNALAQAENNLNNLDSLIGLIQNKKDLRSINNLSMRMLNFGGLYLRKNAYASLIQSGDIRYLKDYEDKSNIVNLYEFYDWVLLFENISLKSFTENMFPYIRENFDMVNGQLQSEDIYFSKRYANILASYRYTIAEKIQKYKDCQVEIEQYLQSH